MKKTIALLIIACMYYIYGTGLAFGVSFLKFEREFSGKGSTNGAFSKNVHVAFDAEGNIYVSDADNRLLQKLCFQSLLRYLDPSEKTRLLSSHH